MNRAIPFHDLKYTFLLENLIATVHANVSVIKSLRNTHVTILFVTYQKDVLLVNTHR